MHLPDTLPRRLAISVFLMVFVLLVAACGSEPEEEPEPEVSLDELLASAGENLAAVSTIKFTMIDEMESGAPYFGANLKKVEGEVISRKAARLAVDVEAPAMGFVEIQIVAVGEQARMKFSRDAPWLPIPLEEVPFKFESIGPVLSDLLSVMTDSAITGQESVGGFQTIRIDGNVLSEDMANLITSVDSGHPITLSYWVDEVDHTVRQFRIDGQLFDDDAPETSRLVTIDIDVPVDIQLPDMAAGS